jgi:hypothetical protein
LTIVPFMSMTGTACVASGDNTVKPDQVRSGSKIVVPVFSVCRKIDSSPTAICRTRFASSLSSGYCGAMVSTVASTRSLMTGSCAPSSRIIRIVRRISRRST